MLDLGPIKDRVIADLRSFGSVNRGRIIDERIALVAEVERLTAMHDAKAEALAVAESEVERLRAALAAEVDAKLALSLRMDSIASTLSFASKDWVRNRHEAWIYAVAVGWGDQIEEVAAIHRWESFEVDRLCKMQPNNLRRAAGAKP